MLFAPDFVGRALGVCAAGGSARAPDGDFGAAGASAGGATTGAGVCDAVAFGGATEEDRAGDAAPVGRAVEVLVVDAAAGVGSAEDFAFDAAAGGDAVEDFAVDAAAGGGSVAGFAVEVAAGGGSVEAFAVAAGDGSVEDFAVGAGAGGGSVEDLAVGADAGGGAVEGFAGGGVGGEVTSVVAPVAAAAPVALGGGCDPARLPPSEIATATATPPAKTAATAPIARLRRGRRASATWPAASPSVVFAHGLPPADAADTAATGARMRLIFSIDDEAAEGTYGASPIASSATLWNRSAGSFSRQRRITASNPGGTSRPWIGSGGGGSIVTRTTSSVNVSASNGIVPLAS